MRHTLNLLLDVNLQPTVLTVYSHRSELEYYTAMTTPKGGWGFIVDFNLLMYK